MTAISDHVTDPGIKEMAWSSEPYGVLWCVRNDGLLFGCTFDKDQQLAAWHRHLLGGSHVDGSVTNEWGKVESVAVIPHTEPNGECYDQVWMLVQRRINGVDTRFVEYMGDRLRIHHDAKIAFHVDAAPAPYDDVPQTLFTVGTHLEGETVEIWGDAAVDESMIVNSSGQVTANNAVSYAVIGLGYKCIFDSLPMEAGSDDGTTLIGVKKRVVEAFLLMHRSLGGMIGGSAETLVELQYRTDTHLMDTGVPLFTGLFREDVIRSEWSREGLLTIEVTGPTPWHLNSLIGRVDWSDR